jgi:hypothetical protein
MGTLCNHVSFRAQLRQIETSEVRSCHVNLVHRIGPMRTHLLMRMNLYIRSENTWIIVLAVLELREGS